MKGEKISAAKTTHGHSGGYVRIDKDAASKTATHGGIRKTKIARNKINRIRENRDHLTYKRWCSMKKRVTDKSDGVFKYYGAKGIVVCERWQKYENFLADMGECPEGLTLDRLDPNKNYEPSNCRWATWSQQHRQRMMTEVCPQCGMQRQTCGADRLTPT